MDAPSKKSSFRWVRFGLISLVGLLLIILLEPHLLRFAIKQSLVLAARSHDARLAIGEVQGSLWAPITFRNVQFSSSLSGIDSMVSVKQGSASFSWKALFLHRGYGFFDRLTINGLTADLMVESESSDQPFIPAPEALRRLPGSRWLPWPARLDLAHADVTLRLGHRSVILTDAQFSVSASEPGQLNIESVSVETDHLKKKFVGLKGGTAVQNTRLLLTEIKLEKGILIQYIAADLSEAARGRLRVDFEFAAFDGTLRGELINTAPRQNSECEVAGSFSNISVAALADFLNIREKTGGVIKEGKFSFRGSPHAIDQATVSTRFEASDFLWGKRQWNSFILGATIVNRRIDIPELHLQQAHNILDLKGALTLPEADAPWWLSDFNFDVAGRINNLTELSSLFGPYFAKTAGIMTIDGAVRGAKKTFSGQLLIHGSKLSYRGAPIDLLNAGIKLDGNEFQVINLELANDTDFVRGKGTVTILGERRYSGELKIAVGDLTNYAPLLEKPIAPAPLAGGIVVDWSGDGSADAHSGAFKAQLLKFRSLGSAELPATLPIDAKVEGTYAPGGLFLSKCSVANADTYLETRLTADVSTLKLEGLRLTQKKVLWLEGDATLPLNLWHWWTAPSLAAITPDAPFNVQLNAKGVQLEEVAHLTGRPIPIQGLLTGSLHTEGTLREPLMSGSLKLTKGRLPASEWLPALENMEAETEVDGPSLRLTQFSAQHANGRYTATGAINFAKFDAPVFDLLLHGEKVRFNAGNDWAGTANLDVTVSGAEQQAAVNGSAEVLSLERHPHPDFGALISTGNIESIKLPAPAIALPKPLDRWTYNIAVTTTNPIKLATGAASLDLRLSGTGTPLAATGSVTFSGLQAGTSFAIGKLENGTWFFSSDPAEPQSLVAHLSGKLVAEDRLKEYDGYFFGPINRLSSLFNAERKEDDELIRRLFTPGVEPLPPEASQLQIDLGPLRYDETVAAQFEAKPEAATPTPPPLSPSAP